MPHGGRVSSRRAQHASYLLPQRVWALREDGHEAAMDIKAVPGVGAEIVLTVDGELEIAVVPGTRADRIS